jgi:tripeptidyl-peptidase-1
MQKHSFTSIEGNMDAELVLAISYPTPFRAYSTGGSPPFKKDLFTPTNTNEPVGLHSRDIPSHRLLTCTNCASI